MSQLRDLQARMAEITRLLKTQGAGKTTQVIHEALAAAGLKSRNADSAANPGATRKESSLNAAHSGTSSNFVGDLLAKLGLAGTSTAGLATEEEKPSTEHGKFVAGSYSNKAGSRHYKVYIPSGHDGKAMPLVVMLHGCTQDPDDFARGTQMNVLAEEKGFVVVYPQQDRRANVSKCWNWYNAIDQQRDQGEPSLIAGITNQVIEQYGLDRHQVFVAGLSAGGAMAIIMGSTYPDLYKAVGVHSGLPYASASDLPSALNAMKGTARKKNAGQTTSGASLESIPIIVFHGDRDVTVNPSNGIGLINDFVANFEETSGAVGKISTVVEEGESDAGQSFSRTSLHVDGRPVLAEHWLIHGAGHAWVGGNARGSYTDPKGPDASREMLRFFRTQIPEPKK